MVDDGGERIESMVFHQSIVVNHTYIQRLMLVNDGQYDAERKANRVNDRFVNE